MTHMEQCIKERLGVEALQTYMKTGTLPLRPAAPVDRCDKGGFSVPAHLVDEVMGMLQPKEKSMILFQTGRWTLNLDNMSDFSYSLETITKELADGDIYKITVNIIMNNTDEFAIDELDELQTFVRTIGSNQSDRYMGDGSKTLAYYLSKAVDYNNVKEGKKEK